MFFWIVSWLCMVLNSIIMNSRMLLIRITCLFSMLVQLLSVLTINYLFHFYLQRKLQHLEELWLDQRLVGSPGESWDFFFSLKPGYAISATYRLLMGNSSIMKKDRKSSQIFFIISNKLSGSTMKALADACFNLMPLVAVVFMGINCSIIHSWKSWRLLGAALTGKV